MSEAADEPVAVSWDDAVEELYGLLRDDFIARRDELAKQARAAGDKETAGAIGRLRKPSAAAWLANMLAREHGDEIGALEELGASMRSAQQRLEGDALRRLSRQRHELVHALVERARRVAREDGVRVGDAVVRELERTITAALADPEAARALAAGRLVTALEPGAGLGAATATAPPADGAAPRPARRRSPSVTGSPAGSPTGPPASGRDDRAEREEREERERAERERLEGVLAEARAEADRADATVGEARQVAASVSGEVDDAVSTVADLRSRLAAAEEAERLARDRASAAARDVVARGRDAEDAAARVRRAERDLAELPSPG